MDRQTLESILTIGETVAVEFKRCGTALRVMYMKAYVHF